MHSFRLRAWHCAISLDCAPQAGELPKQHCRRRAHLPNSMSDKDACEGAPAAAMAAGTDAEGQAATIIASAAASGDAEVHCGPGAAAPAVPDAAAEAASEAAAECGPGAAAPAVPDAAAQAASEAAAVAEAAAVVGAEAASAAAAASQEPAAAADGSMDVDALPPAEEEQQQQQQQQQQQGEEQEEEHARKRQRLRGSAAAAEAAQAAAAGEAAPAAAAIDADAAAAAASPGAAAADAPDGEGSSSTGTAAGAPGGVSSSSCGGGAVADAASPEVAAAAAGTTSPEVAAAAASADAAAAAAVTGAAVAAEDATADADAAAAAAAAASPPPAAAAAAPPPPAAAAAAAASPPAAAAAAAAGGAGLDADAAAAAAIMQGFDGGPACMPGTPEFQAAAKAADEALQTYDARVEQLRSAKRKKPDMIAYSELRGELTPAEAHGHVPGVAVGRVFQGRGQLALLGLHTNIPRGVMARQGEPAFAIVLSGGYKDDADTGRVFWYTGAGGQDPGSKKQVSDQSVSHPDNAAMIKSVEQSTPVRVFRGQKSADGGREYVYEGLHHVAAYKIEPSEDGPLVVRFKMVAIPGHSAVNATVTYKCLATSKFTQRVLAAEAPPGRKRGRKSEAPVVLLSAKQVAAQVQQRADAGSHGRLVMDDVSGGEEKLPIPVWNAVDDDDRLILPLGSHDGQQGGAAAAAAAAAEAVEFTYISDYRYGEQAALDLATAGEFAFNRGFTEKCGLKYHHPSPQHRDTAFYLSYGLLHLTNPCGVMECDEVCEGRNCKRNRVIAAGLRFPLELFKAEGGKGWGVRCAVDLQPGSVLCTYIGEILTDKSAEALRGRDLYLFDLDHFHRLQAEDEAEALPAEQWRNPHMPDLPQELRETHLVIDARTQSNVARFINHSCAPNCTIQTVLSGNARSQLLYYIAIVAAQHIPAFTEITYDYGDAMASRFSCSCGAANCRNGAGAQAANAAAPVAGPAVPP